MKPTHLNRCPDLKTKKLSTELQVPILPLCHARDLLFPVDVSGMIGWLVLFSIEYLLLVLGSSARSVFELSISCSCRSTDNSPGGSAGELDSNSFGKSIGLVRLDLCFTMKVAPPAPRTIAAVQPTTTPITAL